MLAAIPFRTFPQLSIGPVTIRTFGVFVAIGIVVGVWVFLRYARDRDLDADLLSRLAWWVIVLGIIGSRAAVRADPLERLLGRPAVDVRRLAGRPAVLRAFLISIVVIVWFTRRTRRCPGWS